MDPVVFDFSAVTGALGDLGPAIVLAAGGVILAGLGVAAVRWGAPVLVSLFKRTAK